MTGPRIGSLFSGYGGLDMGVQAVLGGDVVWHCDIEPASTRLLAHHHPAVPNLGDVTAVDWDSVEPVDVLAGGYPCQPFSTAGRRRGTEDERHLWPAVADAIGALRPALFVGENVRGHLNLGFDQVVRDLDILGYDVSWRVLRAADVGAPHGRARLFILGRNRARHLRGGAPGRRGLHRNSGGGGLLPGSGEGRDDRQGSAIVAGSAAELWRCDLCLAGANITDSVDADVACERRGGAGVPDSGPPAPTGQGRCSRPSDDVAGHSRECGATSERAGGVDDGDASASCDLEGTDPGGESSRPGPGAAAAADRSADCDPPLGCLVGTGRVVVRSGGVRGRIPDERRDGRGTCLRATCDHGDVAAWPVADAGCVEPERRGVRGVVDGAAGPGEGEGPERERDRDTVGDGSADAADADGIGPTWSGAARAGRRGSTDDGVVAAAAVRDGREGRTERDERPARGQSAPFGDDAAGRVLDWAAYGPAVRRWEQRLGRVAPAPTQTGARGGQQLSPLFVEWLMGLPAGWVTGVRGVSRNEQLKLLGNGVVPQQAELALRHLLVGPALEVAA